MRNLTNKEQLALRAVIYLAATNKKVRTNGFYYNRRTEQTIDFDEALCIAEDWCKEVEKND